MVDDKTIVFPDYPGNGLFQSLGNLLENPNIGMLFIDFEKGQRLRQELRDLANDVASRGIVSEFSVTEINRRLESIRGAWRITRTEDGRKAVFEPESQPTSQLQWPILQSIMTFLSGKNEQRLKPCDNHECIPYFYDTSKNSTRRWCRMDVCGNREKARRHYRKRTVD